MPTAPVLPGAGHVEACSLLTDAEIESATGRSVASKQPGTVQGVFENGCTWELELAEDDYVGWSIDVGVISPGGRRFYDTYVAPFAEGPVPNLGDAAVSQEVGGIDVVKGDTLVSVFVVALNTDDEDAVTRELAQAAISHVP